MTAQVFRNSNIGMRFRKHSVLRMPSRMLIALFSLLFLVSTQFCYAMAHDLPLTAAVIDCHTTAQVAKHGGGHSTPTDHGKKASAACVMMSCGASYSLAPALLCSPRSRIRLAATRRIIEQQRPLRRSPTSNNQPDLIF